MTSLAARRGRRPDAQAERAARTLDSLAHCLAALPDRGSHAGKCRPTALEPALVALGT